MINCYCDCKCALNCNHKYLPSLLRGERRVFAQGAFQRAVNSLAATSETSNILSQHKIICWGEFLDCLLKAHVSLGVFQVYKLFHSESKSASYLPLSEIDKTSWVLSKNTPALWRNFDQGLSCCLVYLYTYQSYGLYILSVLHGNDEIPYSVLQCHKLHLAFINSFGREGDVCSGDY